MGSVPTVVCPERGLVLGMAVWMERGLNGRAQDVLRSPRATLTWRSRSVSSESPLCASGAACNAARYRQSSLYFPQLDGEKPDLNGYNQLDHNSLEQPAAQGSNVVNKGAGLLSYSHLNSLNLKPDIAQQDALTRRTGHVENAAWELISGGTQLPPLSRL